MHFWEEGTPLPPAGGGVPYPLPCPVRLTLFFPSFLIILAVVGLWLGVPPPNPSYCLHMVGHTALLVSPSFALASCALCACASGQGTPLFLILDGLA